MQKIIRTFLASLLACTCLCACSSTSSSSVPETTDLTGSTALLGNITYSINPDFTAETGDNQVIYYPEEADQIPVLWLIQGGTADESITEAIQTVPKLVISTLLEKLGITADDYEFSSSSAENATILKAELSIDENGIGGDTSFSNSIFSFYLFACDNSELYMMIFCVPEADQGRYNIDEFIQNIDFSACAKPESTPEPSPEASPEAAPESTEVTADLKEFLDSYEAFMDEYVAFMNEYQENSSDMNLLMQYAGILSQY